MTHNERMNQNKTEKGESLRFLSPSRSNWTVGPDSIHHRSSSPPRGDRCPTEAMCHGGLVRIPAPREPARRVEGGGGGGGRGEDIKGQ